MLNIAKITKNHQPKTSLSNEYNRKSSPKQPCCNFFLCVGLKGEFISNKPNYLRLLKTSDGNLGTDSLKEHAQSSVCILTASVRYKCSNKCMIKLINMYNFFCL